MKKKSDNKLIINLKETPKLLSKSKDSIIENENNKSKKKSNLIKKIKDSSLNQFTPIKNSNHNIIYSNTFCNKKNEFNIEKSKENKIR